MPDDRNITNPGQHEHITQRVGGQDVCMSCRQVVVKPILDFNDERLDQSKMWLEAMIANLGGTPIDFQLMELADRLGDIRAPYIMNLMEKYGDEEPPHVKTIAWWNTP